MVNTHASSSDKHTPPLALPGPSTSALPSSSTAWTVDEYDKATAPTNVPSLSYTGASWLLDDVVSYMIAHGMEFRLAVPSGRNGRTLAWTVSPRSRPANIAVPPAGHVLVILPKRRPPVYESRRADELYTIHPLKEDQGQAVWFLVPWNSVRTGVLRKFDVDNTVTPADQKKYATGAIDAIASVKNAICTVDTLKGPAQNVSNSYLVRISTIRLSL